jgi:hypothetical protein
VPLPSLGIGAGRPGLATKGELLLLLLSMVSFLSSRITSIRLFFAVFPNSGETKIKPDLLHCWVPSTSKPLNRLSPS